mgnify:CR=1 FL=1
MENNNVIKLMQNLEKEFIASCDDAERFVLGNKSAGTRVRKHMQKIKKLAQEVRVEIQNQKHAVTA